MSAMGEMMMGMLARARLDVPRRVALAGAGKSWWVYGAGKMGRKVAKALQDSGRRVQGFIDPAKHGVFDGLECLGVEAAMFEPELGQLPGDDDGIVASAHARSLARAVVSRQRAGGR